MRKVLEYAKVVLGSLIIALAINAFFVPYDLLPAGIPGLGLLYAKNGGVHLSIFVGAANLMFLLLARLTLSKTDVKKFILPAIAVPLFIYICSDINTILDLKSVDELLLCLYGGVLVGIGYRFIYKEGFYASGADIISTVESKYFSSPYNIINYSIDGIVLFFAVFLYGLEVAMYSLIAIVTIEYLSKRATIGTSDSKVFYIITKKENEVRDFILNELGYTLTSFGVKGGFLKTKNTILMSVIPTKDYYKLREGIKAIDKHAFISITDSYEVVNAFKK